ncbi:MAG: IS110 family RNA-guided transposase [Planctomycetota bacterium]|jgi:transposase
MILYFRGKNAKRILCAYEASGVGYGLYDRLRDEGLECHILAPTKIKRSQKDRKDKTDAKDALRILQALRNHVFAGDELPTVWVPDLQMRDDRELVRARLDVGKKATAIKAQIRALLKRSGAKKEPGVGTSWTLSFKNWLLDLACGRREGLASGARAVLLSLLRNLKFLEGEESRLEQEIAVLAEKERYRAASRALTRLPGIGTLTAMVFLTEMGDLGRFRNRRKVGAYLGLAPSSFESGEKDDRKGHITREGPSRIRKVLNQSTWARIRFVDRVKEHYEGLILRNPKQKKIAVVALMRRLAIQMWQVAKNAS